MNVTPLERFLRFVDSLVCLFKMPLRKPRLSGDIIGLIEVYKRHRDPDERNRCIDEIRFSRSKGAISREEMDFLMKYLN